MVGNVCENKMPWGITEFDEQRGLAPVSSCCSSGQNGALALAVGPVCLPNVISMSVWQQVCFTAGYMHGVLVEGGKPFVDCVLQCCHVADEDTWGAPNPVALGLCWLHH